MMEQATRQIGTQAGGLPINPKEPTITDQLSGSRQGLRELLGRMEGLVNRVGVYEQAGTSADKVETPDSPHTQDIARDIDRLISQAHENMLRLERIA